MKVHFLGIGGSGASAAAAIAQFQGFEVSGCDLEPHNEFTSVFQSNQLLAGHNPQHLYCQPKDYPVTLSEAKGITSKLYSSPPEADQNDKNKKTGKTVDILAVTPAIYSLDPDNPELLEAKKKGIPVMTWQAFLGKYLAKEKFVIAVTGTHGKTTTTAMIGLLLENAGLDPTVELGGIVPSWGANYRLGKGDYFVVEADEFNDNFLHFNPIIAVVTNIEMDHPEYFKDFEAVKMSFKKFMLQTKNTVVANLEDTGVAEVVKVAMKESGTPYLDYSKNELGLDLKIPGDFNRLNAKAAMQVGLLLGISPQVIKQSLENYRGVGRRFEYIGEYIDAKVYSDFGHHPTEIKVTIEAARQKFPDQRIMVIYQPHMFSRTKALFSDFVKILSNAPVDKIFVMDIYPSREVNTGLVSSKQLVEAINKPSVVYIGNTSQTLANLKPEIKKGDILFFMSAGDTDRLAKELVKG